jgi:mannose-6-phosphate isomerase-like protein (cupin superfamily)
VNDDKPGVGGRPHRRGVSIYPASNAVDNATSGFRGVSTATSESGERLLALHEAGHALGVQSNLLVRQTDEEGGFSLLLVWGKPNYPLPRHSHMSDCMYFVVSGSATMGNITLRAGDSFYAPNGAPYQYTAGPDGIEVLEIRRNVDTIGTQMSDVSPETAERYRQSIEANRDRWAALEVSPTFAANREPSNESQEEV